MNYCVFGLQFGDEGKGRVVSEIAHQKPVKLVVRYNGGAQSAHNVVVGGVHHCFRQFGSGTLQGIPTFLDRQFLFNPIEYVRELKELEKKIGSSARGMMQVHESCLITTPYHVALNRIQALSRFPRFQNTTGMGIGTTVQSNDDGWRLLWGTCGNPASVRYYLGFVREWARQNCPENEDKPNDLSPEELEMYHKCRELLDSDEQFSTICSLFREIYKEVGNRPFPTIRDDIVFEGSQGVLLDQEWGQYDTNTWSQCRPYRMTRGNSSLAFDGDVVNIGVIRTYLTRHGTGPMGVPFDPSDEDDAMWLSRMNELHNRFGRFQGDFRCSRHNSEFLRRALDLTNPDAIAVTHLDVAGHLGFRRKDQDPDLMQTNEIRDEVARLHCLSTIGPETGQASQLTFPKT